MNVINKNGTQINYNIAVSLMDDEIREELHARLAPCTDEVAHAEKFGEEWELSKENPCW